MATKDKEERRMKEWKFLDLCSEGDLETVKNLLAEDPSLISCKDDYGKCNRSMTKVHS